MPKVLLILLIVVFISTACYAHTIKGSIEKVDIKSYEIIIDGKRISVSKALVFTQNDMNVTKTVIIRDLKEHKGETAICYGSIGSDNIFNAYKVRVLEGHK